MNIVFLDIDGVIQPYDSDMYFFDSKMIKEISNIYGIDYSMYNPSDVISAYYDWDKQAISRLKYILNETKSKIIISSNWRSTSQPNKMKDLLAIHGLDVYHFADNIILPKSIPEAKRKALEIKDSLTTYDISNFAVLDDLKELANYYPNNSIITHNLISISDMNNCIKLLKKR